jgi:hypothetical protein
MIAALSLGTLVTASTDKRLNRQADISRDLSEEGGSDVSAFMEGDGRTTTIGVAELLVGAALAHFHESQADQD